MPYQQEHSVIQLTYSPENELPYSLGCSLHPVWIYHKEELPAEYRQYLIPDHKEKTKFRTEEEAIQVSDRIERDMENYIEMALRKHEEDFGQQNNSEEQNASIPPEL